ncbi:MAG: CBS domain-containing protein [Alphaproteobacteria bacterium]|nr:CBS domain-containing protein [Alphaproteobacteria bacterium]
MRRSVRDIIGKKKLVKAPGSASVRVAVKEMVRRDVRSVLVTERGRLAGIFTGTDLMRLVASGCDLDATPLRDVMTRTPRTVAPGEPAIEGLRRMQEGGFRHLPVVDDGKLAGILSRRDYLGFEIDEIEREQEVWERL